MDYTSLFANTLTSQGFDLHAVYNCFDPPYRADTGWPLKLPNIEFKHNTLLLLHFQDFITPCQGRILELEQVERHYGANADRVLVTYWSHNLQKHYQGPVNLIEFSNHNMATVATIRARESQWTNQINAKTSAWQCLNGRMCLHRRRAVDILQHWPNGVLSYGNDIPLDAWAYDTYRGTENEDNFMRLLPIYAKCQVNIVTETQYDEPPGIVSEKTLMAMIAQQVPIVIGHQGIVQDCRELGFDMFDDLVDTSYDSMPNDIRVEQAIIKNQDLILGKINLAPYQERLQKQRSFLLDEFVTGTQQRYIQDVEQLAKKLSAI
jgi:hypothetical protein